MSQGGENSVSNITPVHILSQRELHAEGNSCDEFEMNYKKIIEGTRRFYRKSKRNNYQWFSYQKGWRYLWKHWLLGIKKILSVELTDYLLELEEIVRF